MDKENIRAEMQRVMDSAREKLKEAESKFDEATRSGKEASDDVLREIEKTHQEVSATLSNWWDDIKRRVHRDKSRDIGKTSS